MSKTAKIVIIGAGSLSFGRACIRDAFAEKDLWGSELVFVDLNEESLNRMTGIAERQNRELKAGFKISRDTERRKALEGADFVIVSIAVNRNALWKLDFDVPRKYGLRHILGENGGPGAVFHTMRNIPIVLDICKDMEELCPEALLINFTNPESRICLAVNKFTKIKAVGLCHQIAVGRRIVSKITDVPVESVDIKAYGLNHFTWIKDIRDSRDGTNLYPVLREKEPGMEPDYEPLSRYLFHRFGLFPTAGDGHLGEYFPFAHEMTSDEGYEFDIDEVRRQRSKAYMDGIFSGETALDAPSYLWDENDKSSMLTPSGEAAFKIIKAMTCAKDEVLLSANIPNDGYITNLPPDAIVEVPAIAGGFGVRGIGMGSLPRGIAALCSAQINVQHLNVEAAVSGDRNLLLQALLTDPNVPSADAAERICAELLEIHKEYYPAFK